ncbi:MAG: electron transfer flavoprotein subunit beta/FixA family protein [Desulfobulbaceae bacterium]|jgi:electron transfer flavoprotein beta subunit|nr:electron transfer flavoprotein subunit beta/FixA family protein [Desulfobulbaceae bacterium]
MIKIFVCLKQVPDTKDIRLDPVTHTLSREGVQSIMNPYDEHALEEAVRIKETIGGEVTALTMGPPQAEEMLRLAVSLGADKAVLVSDRAFAGADTCATTYALAQTLNHLGGADLILCGKQAIDGDTAQVGPGLAVRLDMPFATCVQKIRTINGESLTAERMMDDGYDVVELKLPALVTVVKDINEPRVPSLKGKMRAKSAVITRLAAADIGADATLCGLAGSPTQVAKVFPPPGRGGRVTLAGDLDQQIGQLAERLSGYFS